MRIQFVTMGLLLATAASAQTEAVHRTTLQEQQFPDPKYHTVTVKTVIDPGGTVTAHTHPGAEMAYVENGSASLTLPPAAPRTLAAGDSFTIVQGTVHSLTNAGTSPLTVISTYVVERGKPVAIPAR
jgi:quercetin dioxygenase-like cupin family protein